MVQPAAARNMVAAAIGAMTALREKPTIGEPPGPDGRLDRSDHGEQQRLLHPPMTPLIHRIVATGTLSKSATTRRPSGP
jgi:hypothetical protein